MRRISIIAAALLAIAATAEAAPRQAKPQGMRAQPVADVQAARRDAAQAARRAPRDITGWGRPVGRPFQP